MITCLEQLSFVLFLSMLNPEIVEVQSSTKVIIHGSEQSIVWVYDQTSDSYCIVEPK